MFQSERDETPECQFATTPNDITNTDAMTHTEMMGGIEKFAFFMRFLGAPIPSIDRPGGAASIYRGKSILTSIGCALCHTPTLTRATPRLRRFAVRRSISIPICYYTRWDLDCKMASVRDNRGRRAFAPRLSEVWDSAFSFFMTDVLAIL